MILDSSTCRIDPRGVMIWGINDQALVVDYRFQLSVARTWQELDQNCEKL